MKIKRLTGALGALASSLILFGSLPVEAHTKLRGALPLYFHKRPAVDGTRRHLPATDLAPVTLRLRGPATSKDLAALSRPATRAAAWRGGADRR